MNIAGHGSEVTTQRTTAGASQRLLPVFRLPLYLHVTLVILAVTAVVLMGWVVLVRQPVQPENPVAPYAEIFPGQPRSALMNLSCPSFLGTSPTESWVRDYCALTPQKSAFWQVSVVIKDSIVQRTDFAVRKDNLTLGDLVFLWGRPEVRVRQKLAVFEWEKLGIIGIGWTESRQVSYFTPVTRLSISSPSASSPLTTYR